MKLKVLYEDNHLIAVYKPAGILTQGDSSKDVCMMDMVKDYLKKKYHKPYNVFLGLLHRLDRQVQGIVLFAKTSKGASRLSEQFRSRKVEKIYHAVVLGEPKRDLEKLVSFLKKNEKENIKRAELFYEVLASNKKYSLLKIRLQTGRFHQIRVQLSLMGFPILGDVRCGAPFLLPDKNIALSATSLSFKLATSKKIISSSPPFSSYESSVKEDMEKISIPIPGEWREYVKF